MRNSAWDTRKKVTSPCQVENIVAEQVACGEDHSLILGTDKTVYVMGYGGQGQLGRVPSSLVPVPIHLPFDVQSIHCSGQYSIIRATDGCLWTTGLIDRALARKNRRKFSKIPNFACLHVECGLRHVVALDDENRLWGWGSNEDHQLGLATSCAVEPTLLRDDVDAVLAGELHTIVRTKEDNVEACGYNYYGQLGNGDVSGGCDWTTTAIPPELIYSGVRERPPKSARSVTRNPESIADQ